MSKRTIRKASLVADRFHPIANIFPLMEGEAFDSLAQDIKANGLHEPIVEFEGLILDGRNRYGACVKVGAEPRFREFDGDDATNFVISANLHRRHLNESQRAMVMARLATRRAGKPSLNPPFGAISQAEAAAKLNVGVRTGQRARVVIDKGVPELIRRVDQGELPVGVAASVAALPPDVQQRIVGDSEGKLRSAAKQHKRTIRELALSIKTEAASATLGSRLYNVILADPPWRFEPYSRQTGLDRAADNHYPTMTIADIAKIKPPAAKDCALFLWATAPMLPEALDVMKAWGFTYRSHFIWAKDRIGTGYWARNQHELLLIGIRGNVPAPAPGEQFASVIQAPIGKHSVKPFQFYEIIDSMFPSAKPLEMFARGVGRMVGWDVWGNEAVPA